MELDRVCAIASAIAEAGPEDLVLIAGRGHEQVQEVGNRRLPISDHQLVQAALLEDEDDERSTSAVPRGSR
jgi:UDP-N-acetylmuramoyl-L-alanyl-D-glutamate--2,6-diaminopimelate ligase